MLPMLVSRFSAFLCYLGCAARDTGILCCCASPLLRLQNTGHGGRIENIARDNTTQTHAVRVNCHHQLSVFCNKLKQVKPDWNLTIRWRLCLCDEDDVLFLFSPSVQRHLHLHTPPNSTQILRIFRSVLGNTLLWAAGFKRRFIGDNLLIRDYV